MFTRHGHKAKWTNGKRCITGYWEYIWHANRFRIDLDSTNSITGNKIHFTICGDTPEWDKWKLIERSVC